MNAAHVANRVAMADRLANAVECHLPDATPAERLAVAERLDRQQWLDLCEAEGERHTPLDDTLKLAVRALRLRADDSDPFEGLPA